MKIFMTGATGFVGSFLAELLIKKGHSVRCLVRKESNLRWIADLNVECHYGSLSDLDSLKRGIAGCDTVIHVAGVTKARTEEDYFMGNFQGTKNLVDACTGAKDKIKRFINISSQAAVGPSPTIIPIDETHKPDPLTFYGKSKLAGEEYVLANADKIPVTNLRPPAVYGPRETDILEFFRTVRYGIIPQLGGVNKYLSLIHVHDLVRGIVMAMDSKKTIGKTYFITSTKPYSWLDIAKTTLDVLGKKGIRISIPVGIMKAVSVVSEGVSSITKKPALVNSQKIIEMEQDFWTCAPDKARKDFGFESEIDLQSGIADTIAWYKEHRWM